MPFDPHPRLRHIRAELACAEDAFARQAPLWHRLEHQPSAKGAA